ncbi:hypothetical protein ['Paenibacillus yunnanensis' Narsing Rao et al. 2020]|uniref:hypothetical protein n=1 Tax=Paenibacillus tengchongensis TaxID=2608684 RepID=UPI0016521AE9|nr:hypothetical protein [Paenibacillus tengchongensis]
MMDSQPEQDPKNKAAADKKLQPADRTGKQGTEFAEELTRSDVEQAFTNPITGEERLY